MSHGHPVQDEDKQHVLEANALWGILGARSPRLRPFIEKHHGKQNFMHNPNVYKYRIMISS